MTFVMVATARAGSTATAALHAARTALGDVEQRTTATVGDLDAALDALDGRTLVVAGGDGSLHLAVARLHARRELVDTRIALLPLGNGQGAGGFSGGGTPLLPHAEPDDGLLDRRRLAGRGADGAGALRRRKWTVDPGAWSLVRPARS